MVIKRRLPPEFGRAPIFVTPAARLGYWRPNLWSTGRLLLARALELIHEGDRVWDVGANVGLFSMAAAARSGPAGSVIAIEPDLWLASLLQRSCELAARTAPIDVLPVAVSSEVDLVELVIAARGREGNHLLSVTGSTQSGGSRQQRRVAAITLDWLLARTWAPHLVKIDVEGAEVEVLRGARILLQQVRPVLLIEVDRENAAAVAKILDSCGYTMFDADQLEAARRPLITPAWNTLAFPPTQGAHEK